MQVCTSLQTDKQYASTPPLCFLQAGCPSCRPTNSVKALKAYSMQCNNTRYNLWCMFSLCYKHTSYISYVTEINCLLQAVEDILCTSKRSFKRGKKYFVCFKEVCTLWAVDNNRPRSRAAGQETGWGAFLTRHYHPCIPQEPLLQSRAHAGHRQLVPSDSTADDPVPCELIGGTWLARAGPCGCHSGSSVVSWMPSAQRPEVTCAADVARMHTRRCTSSRKTPPQTCIQADITVVMKKY